jgi:hypothetical protein
MNFRASGRAAPDPSEQAHEISFSARAIFVGFSGRQPEQRRKTNTDLPVGQTVQST